MLYPCVNVPRRVPIYSVRIMHYRHDMYEETAHVYRILLRSAVVFVQQ